MILDPILRFNWIFYAIYSNDLQHSALLSFFVGFSEVCRRGIWTLFRVENEHCTNVGRFRASRDVPLPYDIGPQPLITQIDGGASQASPQLPPSPGDFLNASPTHHSPPLEATSSTLEAQPSPGIRRRRPVPNNTPIQRGIARVGTIMGQAHAQDFERKRKPTAPESASPYHGARLGLAESSDEDEDEEVDADVDVGVGIVEGEGGLAEGQEEERREDREDREDLQGAEEILRRQQGV